MSNYHYNDQRGCRQCFDTSGYSELQNTTHYSCDQKCLCRFNDDRSSKDKMYYNWFVLNQNMVLPPSYTQKIQEKIFPIPINK
jgi:hypothetical protein